MMEKGWVSLYRELTDKSIWLESTPEQKTVLVTILLMVNHSANSWEWKGEKYTVEPGQTITSLEQIANKCGKGVSIQNVRTALKRFEKLGFLTNQSTNKNRLITIVNWAFYQAKEDEHNKQVNKQLTSNQQATNKQLTTNNNVNKENNEKNVNNKPSKDILTERFNELWKLYPNKKGKEVAFRSYCKAIKSGVTDETIKDGLIKFKQSLNHSKTDSQYIAHGSTWFNQQRWQDEYINVANKDGAITPDYSVPNEYERIEEYPNGVNLEDLPF